MRILLTNDDGVHAEGLVALGKKDEATAMYQKALAMAPEAQKARIQGILDGLKK